MKRDEVTKLLDSLTQEQRDGIAQLIQETDPDGDYCGYDEDGGSFWCESVSVTLSNLAQLFSSYDPKSVLE
ncbi:MAG: hypothetical protein ACK57V_14750 [Pirellula sp.]|jgi:hypothetical protein